MVRSNMMMKSGFLFLIILILPLYGQSIPFADQSAQLTIPSWNYGNHGVSVVDYNTDGWDDIFFANLSQHTSGDTSYCVLLKNNQDGTFTDVTGPARLKVYGSHKSGIWGDINNDGYPDLFLAEAYGNGRCHLFLNLKNGSFNDLPAGCGINFSAPVATAAFGDYDNDGKLDLFLATEYPEYDFLYRNTSDNDTITFENVSFSAGVAGFTSATPMQVTFIDYDHDGDQDIYAVHDGFMPSSLFSNNGDGTFSDKSIPTGLYDYGVGNSMGVYWKDFDNDGWEEVYVTRIAKGGLYKKQPDGTYMNIADSLGAEHNGMTWGIVWEDFDNDMDDDIFLVNTYGYDGTKSIYYENINGKYFDRASEYGIDFPFALYGLAYGDFNNDGYLDLVASATDGNDKLLLNTKQKSGNWLKISLRGTSVNRMGIGAKVRIVAGNKSQTRTVTAGHSYASQSASYVHFGTGVNKMADTVEIRWGKDNMQKFTNVSVNTYYQLTEGGSLVTRVLSEEDSHIPTRPSLRQNFPNPFNPFTTIEYDIEQTGMTRLTIYDMLGRVVQTHINEVQEPGHYSLRIDASQFSTGTYFYRLRSGTFVETKKMTVIR
ncbi:MAG: VCBS repeat-containing protein [Ignavibacteriales bacterium]|nr:VCBS repeat-containing protein [Ignavibacteriales bacterium]